jgi:hypothetical protein
LWSHTAWLDGTTTRWQLLHVKQASTSTDQRSDRQRLDVYQARHGSVVER